MCVIIFRPATDHSLTEEHLFNCFSNNSDGWGIMYAQDGRVMTLRGMSWAGFADAYKTLGDINLGIHFRIRTHGNIDLRNTHPYKVLSAEEDGHDLWLMHNGTIRIEQEDQTLSDTWHYCQNELRPILLRAPGLHTEEAFRRHMEERVGYSKLLLLDGEGNFFAVGEHKGKHILGCWFSNDHSHHAPIRSSKESWSYYGGARGWVGHSAREDNTIPFEVGGTSAGASESSRGGSAETSNSTPVRAEPAGAEVFKRITGKTAKARYLAKLEDDLWETSSDFETIMSMLNKAEAQWDSQFDEDGEVLQGHTSDPVERIIDEGEISWRDLKRLSHYDLGRLVNSDPQLITSFLEEWMEMMVDLEASEYEDVEGETEEQATDA
ncbi:hypothetical protein [Falsiroseomonas sp. CW058]|uniref:hypothetical protein n=1 Tax=Falsiroseomonas sp. CW058 TaxID=3388664 RepID=UPI003D31C6ED